MTSVSQGALRAQESMASRPTTSTSMATFEGTPNRVMNRVVIELQGRIESGRYDMIIGVPDLDRLDDTPLLM